MMTTPGFRYAGLLFAVCVSVAYPQEADELQFARKVSQARLRAHVKNLVALGNRMGGTPSGDSAVGYLIRAFQRSGLSPEVQSDPPRLVFINHEWRLQVREPRRLRSLIRNEWLAGYSPTVSLTDARLEFLGRDESSDQRLDSAVVLTEHPITGSFYESLVEAGAVCVLSYAPADSNLYSDWAMISSIKESTENRIPVFYLSYGNGMRLRREIEKGASPKIRFMTRTTVREGTPKTVVATLEGKSPEYFLVCAHGDSDSGGPGADDNASGVAGVLELSRILASMVRSGQLPKPEKTIKFAVWGSEYYSSEHYVRRHEDRLDQILGVLNYDEIGTGASRNCLYFESNDIPHHEDLLRVLNSVAEDYVDVPGFWKEATTNPSQGGTDSYVFMPEYLDRIDMPSVLIPSVTVFTAAWNSPRRVLQTPGWRSKAWKGHPDSVVIDFSRYYHSSLDIPARTTEKEPFNMSWAVKAVGIALLRLAW